MEIQDDEVILSTRDIAQAMLGHEAVADQDFQDYLDGLSNKLARTVPKEEQLDPDFQDTIGILRIPYSRRTVELLGTVIAHGAEISRSAETEWQQIQLEPQSSATTRHDQHVQQARSRRKSNLRIVPND